MKDIGKLVLIIALLAVMGGCAFNKHTIATIKAEKLTFRLKLLSPPIEVENAIIHLDRKVGFSVGKVKGKDEI